MITIVMNSIGNGIVAFVNFRNNDMETIRRRYSAVIIIFSRIPKLTNRFHFSSIIIVRWTGEKICRRT